MTEETLYIHAVELLKKLIATSSFSKEEDATADIIQSFLLEHHITSHRHLNNVWAIGNHLDPAKPTLFLNSHHDTVKPNPQYTKDPFAPIVEDGKLYGLGSNDAGGCLVSLISVFTHFYHQNNGKYNLVFVASAEEEISGRNGIETILKDEVFLQAVHQQKDIKFQNWVGIVGEPTKMQLAIAEKGLMVLDGVAHGKAGHAAREEGDNAIYKAMQDISWVNTYVFPKISDWLGPVKMSVTSIHTENKAHNMVPSQCNYVMDVRITDQYTHEEVLEIIQTHTVSNIQPRSMRMRATRIELDHPLIKAGISLGKQPYGSPTSSDKALIPFATVKCGPGDSARSHTADEFIYLDEIKEGIKTYIAMINDTSF